MTEPFLLSRVLLQFNDDDDVLLGELSATAIDGDGNLWVGSDEYMSVERLSPAGPCRFDRHRGFDLTDLVELPKKDQEVDIEGLAYDGGYLWVCGSHSTKRKKPKGCSVSKDLKPLSKIKKEKNRYLLARLPVEDGRPVRALNLETAVDRFAIDSIR